LRYESRFVLRIAILSHSQRALRESPAFDRLALPIHREKIVDKFSKILARRKASSLRTSTDRDSAMNEDGGTRFLYFERI